jgi:hypothetical protein
MKTMFFRSWICFLVCLVSIGTELSAANTDQPTTMTGVVTDSMCGHAHMMNDKTDAECIRFCVKNGYKYALVSGDTIYTLDGNAVQVDRYSGQKVKVTGIVNGKTIKVRSVTPFK